MDLITRGHDAEVVVHVCAEALGGEGECHLQDGPAIPLESARRMACDAGIVRLVEDPDGLPLDVGPKTRSIPPALKRALKARDGGCRFPGCDSTRHVAGHHIEHWAKGGKTALTNLIQLCPHHHRAVHEAGFTVQPDDRGTFWFHRPDGQPIVQTPLCNAVHGDPAAILRNRHHQRGIHIDADTAVPRWDGLPMDDAMAVDGILQDSGKLDDCA